MQNIEIEFYEKGEDVLLIFTGIGGTTKGFQNKYQRIAEQAMQNYGVSVLIATTPSGSLLTLEENFQFVLKYLFDKVKNKNIRIYAMGSSVGGNLVLSFSCLCSQIKKVLAINPLINVNLHKLSDGIKNFSEERITVVCGEMDASCKWVEILPKVNCLQTKILPKIDHYFTDNIQTFIELPKWFLFDD